MKIAWSRTRTLVAGVALIAITNAVALVGVAWNRSGEPESELTLTQRELRWPYSYGFDEEGAGLALDIRWRVLTAGQADLDYFNYHGAPEWLDRAKLESLGFDLSRRSSAARMDRRYERLLPREALLVLELDGPAFQQALERARERVAKEAAREAAGSGKKGSRDPAQSAAEQLKREETSGSRLFAVDAGLDAAALRAKYPDRARYAIVKGIVRAQFNRNRSGEGEFTGHVENLVNRQVNVPIEFRRAIGSVPRTAAWKEMAQEGSPFQITVAFGKRFEPWIIAASAGKP